MERACRFTITIGVSLCAVLTGLAGRAPAAETEMLFGDLPYAEGFTAGDSDPLSALAAHVVSRMGSLAAADGQTLLPAGAALDRLAVDDRSMAHLWITVPAGAGAPVLSEARAAIIDRVLAGAMRTLLEPAGMDLQVRLGSGPYSSIDTWLPPSEAPRPENETSDDTGQTATKARQERLALESGKSAGPVVLSGPSAHAAGQPVGALSGVVVFVSAGHGWTAGTSGWYTQRGLLLNMVEDYGNLEQLNYFVNYLYNAGAVVVPFRPVGYQPIEIVLDNDDPGVTFTGSWTGSTTAAEYYENGVTTSGIRYRYAASSATETAVARYTPQITVPGFYPVYCWTRDNVDRVLQTYRVRHSGGISTVRIDHQRVGKGWIWLGTYYFEAGTGGYVEISNQANTVSTVVADAIRFGNGMGDVIGAGPGTISGFAREEECARYWAESEAGLRAVGMPSSIWDCCTDDGDDNVGTAARWAREMNRTNVNNDRWRRIYMEFHSNAAGCGSSTCGAKGTVGLYNETNGTTNQLLYAQTVGQKIETDMKALQGQFEYTWGSRYPNTYHASFAYGAISGTATADEFDATILEVAFHDNTEDTANLLSARVRDAVARSTLQAMVTFLSNSTTFPGTQVPAVFLPEPPAAARAVHDGQGNIVVSWAASPTGPALGHAATGYRVYRSSNGYGFGSPVDAGNVLSVTLGDVPANTTTYLRVAAYNAGGESMPSRTMTVRHNGTGPSRVLLVDGYNRVSRQQNHVQAIPAGSMQRPIARRVNSFDYAVQHATALGDAGRTFDFAENAAVSTQAVALGNYGAVVWILGQESAADKTFDTTEQSLVTAYLNNRGALFVTGAEMAYELDNLAAGRTFCQNLLRTRYVADDAGTYGVTAAAGGVLADVGNLDFDPANGAAYAVNTPDQVAAQPGAVPVLTYVGGTGGAAGVQYDSGVYRVVTFGFPFEAISAAAKRSAVMQRVMNFLLPAAGCPVGPDVVSGFEGYADGARVLFQDPRYSGSTSANLAVTPNSAAVASTVPAYGGSRVCRVDWAWLDTTPGRWLRLTTSQAALSPNPAVDLRRPIRLRLRLDSGSFRLCLGIRETGVDVPVGANGGASGTIEWVGAEGVAAGGAPRGVLVNAQPGAWQTLTFRPEPGRVWPMTGDGYLVAAGNKGVLEHLAFTATDSAGPFTVYLDEIDQPCPPAADFDGDGDVDQEDFGHLQACLTVTGTGQVDAACADASLDGDLDVDEQDFALFAAHLSGPGVPAE